VSVFIAAYVTVWVGFGGAALAMDTGVHRIVHVWPWLEERPFLVAGALLLAGACQFLPVTRRCLAACRDPAGLVARSGGLGAGAWRVGIRHGVACLGATWALMLLMFAVAVHSLAWMALLTGVLAAEKLLPGGVRLASYVGVPLLAAGSFVALR
jgi:predicted metal-binding membrane protein